MKFLLLFSVLFNIIYYLNGECLETSNYFTLGQLTVNGPSNKACKYASDKCIYLTLNIPGLAVGSMTGCQSDIGKIFTSIANQRMDVIDIFSSYFNNTSNQIDMNPFCNFTTSNTPLTLPSLTGKMKYFFNCYDQNTLYPNPPVVFNPPTESATPVKCKSNTIETICTEGYCGVLEVSYQIQNNQTQFKNVYQTCPNQLINTLYVSSHITVNVQNPGFQVSVNQIGVICVNQKTDTIYSNTSKNPYFLYVDCYNPSNGYHPNIPNIPNFPNQPVTANDTTTTTINPSDPITTTTIKLITTTKGSPSNINMSFLLFSLLIISFIFV